jgi:hypothetical protein
MEGAGLNVNFTSQNNRTLVEADTKVMYVRTGDQSLNVATIYTRLGSQE